MTIIYKGVTSVALNILHTPFNEANNPRGLCDAECELGYNSKLETCKTHCLLIIFAHNNE